MKPVIVGPTASPKVQENINSPLLILIGKSFETESNNDWKHTKNIVTLPPNKNEYKRNISLGKYIKHKIDITICEQASVYNSFGYILFGILNLENILALTIIPVP